MTVPNIIHQLQIGQNRCLNMTIGKETRQRLEGLLKAARYAELIAAAEALGPLDHAASMLRHTAVGLARLALAYDRDAVIAAASDLERSSRWLSTDALLDRLAQAIRERRPFAFIRVGDGEARFVATMTAELRRGLSEVEALAISHVAWNIWFRQQIEDVDSHLLSDLMADYRRAVRAVDVLGVSSVALLSQKPKFFGVLAAQEVWLRGLLADRADLLFTDALAHRRLDERSPFFADLLHGLDFLGVIGPHPDLAGRLASRFNIPVARTYSVPGESLLPDAARGEPLGRHFPERYREILMTLAVPWPGAVFLVAAGILGKIYCARIRECGGIALDIGSVADAWMGFETRPAFQNAFPAPLQSS